MNVELITEEEIIEEQPVVKADVLCPLAMINHEALMKLPDDLYIPPDAMRVILEIFEGPLDLLLYLIRKHNIDILDIPVAKITRQYIEYVNLMKDFQLELAAEYLEMAALLAEIKSRMLLPRSEEIVEEEDDPRAELVRRLQEYEQIREAANNLDEVPRFERDLFHTCIDTKHIYIEKPEPEVDLNEILYALKDVLKRVDLQTAHSIEQEALSVRERMSIILSKLEGDTFVDIINFFTHEEGRLGVVVTLLAILEMAKERVVEIVQSEAFAPVYVRLSTC